MATVRLLYPSQLALYVDIVATGIESIFGGVDRTKRQKQYMCMQQKAKPDE